jgi:hypothetical protein
VLMLTCSAPQLPHAAGLGLALCNVHVCWAFRGSADTAPLTLSKVQ